MMKSTAPTALQIQAERPRWTRYQLVDEIREFLSEFGMKPTPFGLAAAKDEKLLWRIEFAPQGISIDKADRIRDYMARYRNNYYEQIVSGGNRASRTKPQRARAPAA